MLPPVIVEGDRGGPLMQLERGILESCPNSIEGRTDSANNDFLWIGAGDDKSIKLSVGKGNGLNLNTTPAQKDMRLRVKHTIMEMLMQIILLPIQIVTISFTAIIIALLYLGCPGPV